MSSTDNLTSQLIGVKANCKRGYSILKTTREHRNEMIMHTENQIVANPTNIALQRLLLKFHEINNWEKTIATYHPVGNTKTVLGQTAQPGDNEFWTVQITRAGKVRICMTDAGEKHYRNECRDIENMPMFKFYGK